MSDRYRVVTSVDLAKTNSDFTVVAIKDRAGEVTYLNDFSSAADALNEQAAKIASLEHDVSDYLEVMRIYEEVLGAKTIVALEAEIARRDALIEEGIVHQWRLVDYANAVMLEGD